MVGTGIADHVVGLDSTWLRVTEAWSLESMVGTGIADHVVGLARVTWWAQFDMNIPLFGMSWDNCCAAVYNASLHLDQKLESSGHSGVQGCTPGSTSSRGTMTMKGVVICW